MAALAAPRVAARLSVTGVVQGVGFRPFVHRLALRHQLAGSVRNTAGDVQILVEGAAEDVDAFVHGLEVEAPPLARIEHIDRSPSAPLGVEHFTILESNDTPDARLPVAPDAAMCGACEAELFDQANRRFRYPFITCTDCGPRYTVIHAMPYDRERTSMRVFTPCAECAREYRTPGDRRYHSETNGCPSCGPRVWLEHPGPAPKVSEGSRAVQAAADRLCEGDIVAIRGLGGFHLAVDATNEHAVQRLRARKRRDAKPFAVMVRTVADARALAEIEPAEAELLESRERPIVVVQNRMGGVAAGVAPGLDTVGLMLAYTPLHHLVLERVGRPLVMTSGNVSDEPIVTGNVAARRELARIVDAFLLHDREIVARYDDSVVRIADRATLLIRRGRGYAPLPLDLPVPTPVPLVAVGPQLKNTFTLATGDRAFVSQHIGDLENIETLDHFYATLAAYRRLFRCDPRVAVRDLHPEYLSTRVAEELGLEQVIPVQHHHAHVAAVLAEHRVVVPVLGVAFDGTGYGDDGNVWGAEFLLADLAGYQRVGHMRYTPLPGGELAIRTPWRAALGYLWLEPAVERAFEAAFAGVSERERYFATQQLAHGLNTPHASSMGRLFDAAAAVLGVRRVAQYEGQAAMELEALAGRRAAAVLPFPWTENGAGCATLDPLPLLVTLGEQRAAGVSVADLAAAFHETVAAATADLAVRAATTAGTSIVALSGGCFQNARLLVSVRTRLERHGLRVLVPTRLGPNDGAVSFGQAAVAAVQLRR